jgi:hypothetical protein
MYDIDTPTDHAVGKELCSPDFEVGGRRQLVTSQERVRTLPVHSKKLVRVGREKEEEAIWWG